MKKCILLVLVTLVASGLAAKAQTIFNGYAYTTSGATPGVSSNWYDLSATSANPSFQGASLGSFNTNLWLGGQTGFWSAGQGVQYITLHYSITGQQSASGSASYSFQSFSAPNDQWGTDVSGAHATDSSVNLIAAHSLANGNYNIAVWVEGKPNSSGSIYDSNGGSNYNASFTVVPEPSTFALLGLGALAIGMMMRRKTLPE